MRCTNCSRVVKPVVAVDIDGTLGDYHSHFLMFACMYMAIEPDHIPTYEGQMGFKEWFLKVFDTDEATWRAIKLAYRQGGQKRSMPVYTDAAALVNNVRDAGAEVWLCTTRPYLRLDAVDPDTRWWLEINEIGYDGLLYDEHKYQVLAQQVETGRVVAVLDDLGDQIISAHDLFGKNVPLMRITKYNREASAASHYHTVRNLYEAQAQIVERVRNWYAEHGH